MTKEELVEVSTRSYIAGFLCCCKMIKEVEPELGEIIEKVLSNPDEIRKIVESGLTKENYNLSEL